jgi:hypothetical protein
VKGNPRGKALRVSIHESEVLMRLIHETFTTREIHPANWLWVDQDFLSNEFAHDLLQGWMVRQGVKRLQIEYRLVGSLEGRVWVCARSTDISYPFEGVIVAHEPARRVKDARYVAEYPAQSGLW